VIYENLIRERKEFIKYNNTGDVIKMFSQAYTTRNHHIDGNKLLEAKRKSFTKSWKPGHW